MMNSLMFTPTEWCCGKTCSLHLRHTEIFFLREMVTRKIPYFDKHFSPQQLTGAVGYGDYQVEIPETGNQTLIKIMKLCLNKDRNKRPTFIQIKEMLSDLSALNEKKGMTTLLRRL